jgi:hypothetical protein
MPIEQRREADAKEWAFGGSERAAPAHPPAAAGGRAGRRQATAGPRKPTLFASTSCSIGADREIRFSGISGFDVVLIFLKPNIDCKYRGNLPFSASEKLDKRVGRHGGIVSTP